MTGTMARSGGIRGLLMYGDASEVCPNKENLCLQLNTEIIFDIKMVTTDKNNRRCGLGSDLLRRTVQLAQSLGYKVSIPVPTDTLNKRQNITLNKIITSSVFHLQKRFKITSSNLPNITAD
jgi:GNAT superfamily N-acetyltransferase